MQSGWRKFFCLRFVTKVSRLLLALVCLVVVCTMEVQRRNTVSMSINHKSEDWGRTCNFCKKCFSVGQEGLITERKTERSTCFVFITRALKASALVYEYRSDRAPSGSLRWSPVLTRNPCSRRECFAHKNKMSREFFFRKNNCVGCLLSGQLRTARAYTSNVLFDGPFTASSCLNT